MWNPESGCVKTRDRVKEAWVKVVGLPLHLWTKEILKLIGEECGGFTSIDKETALRNGVAWARLLVSLKGEILLSSINILARERSYELQLWWEMKSWEAEVFPVKREPRLRKSDPEVEDDSTTHAS